MRCAGVWSIINRSCLKGIRITPHAVGSSYPWRRRRRRLPGDLPCSAQSTKRSGDRRVPAPRPAGGTGPNVRSDPLIAVLMISVPDPTQSGTKADNRSRRRLRLDTFPSVPAKRQDCCEQCGWTNAQGQSTKRPEACSACVPSGRKATRYERPKRDKNVNLNRR